MDSPTISRSVRVAGGPAAPRAARAAVLSLLGGRVGARLLDDAELIVSELVTNSVIHARMGPGDSIGIDVGLSEGRLRIAVADDGAAVLPHVVEPDATLPNGRGLLLVQCLSSAWGVTRERSGATRVWCELPLAAQ